VNQCPIIPGDVFQYKFKVPDQAVSFERAVESILCDLHSVYLRVHSGTTVTFLISIATACVVHLLCAILKIHKQFSMMLMMV
jgi:hypothetical protein